MAGNPVMILNYVETLEAVSNPAMIWNYVKTLGTLLVCTKIGYVMII